MHFMSFIPFLLASADVPHRDAEEVALSSDSVGMVVSDAGIQRLQPPRSCRILRPLVEDDAKTSSDSSLSSGTSLSYMISP